MSKSKIISPAKRLQALALFTIANRHYVKAQESMDALAELLGYQDGYAGRLSDEAIEDRPNFDKALAREGFTVRNATKKAKP